jgi:hypothetical protein
MRVINLEDNAMKHLAIVRALEDMRINDITWVKNVDDGMRQIKEAVKSGTPYDLAISDMQYYLHEGDYNITVDAGDKFISRVFDEGLSLPIIICSSDNLQIDTILGCVWYLESRDWESQLRKLVNQIN